MKLLIFLFSCLANTLSSCNSGPDALNKNDSTFLSPPADSMPIVIPPISDSSGVLKTPPVNDPNVILPDSTY